MNAALDGLTYTPDADYHGPADLQITTESSIVSDAGLQAYYSFDNPGDPGNDDSPLGSNDGTVIGGTTRLRPHPGRKRAAIRRLQ